jgi:hypothetical protein
VASPAGRGVFDGNVRVGRLAQKTDAQQLSRNLLLVPRATVNVKPNLQARGGQGRGMKAWHRSGQGVTHAWFASACLPPLACLHNRCISRAAASHRDTSKGRGGRRQPRPAAPTFSPQTAHWCRLYNAPK